MIFQIMQYSNLATAKEKQTIKANPSLQGVDVYGLGGVLNGPWKSNVRKYHVFVLKDYAAFSTARFVFSSSVHEDYFSESSGSFPNKSKSTEGTLVRSWVVRAREQSEARGTTGDFKIREGFLRSWLLKDPRTRVIAPLFLSVFFCWDVWEGNASSPNRDGIAPPPRSPSQPPAPCSGSTES